MHNFVKSSPQGAGRLQVSPFLPKGFRWYILHIQSLRDPSVESRRCASHPWFSRLKQFRQVQAFPTKTCDFEVVSIYPKFLWSGKSSSLLSSGLELVISHCEACARVRTWHNPALLALGGAYALYIQGFRSLPTFTGLQQAKIPSTAVSFRMSHEVRFAFSHC